MYALSYQRGLTLIELMVSLVLGLLISAAAIQIFYTSTVSSNVQKAGSTMVETGAFGFDYLTKQVRRANHGSIVSGSSESYFLTAETPQGGIVLTAPSDLKVFGEQYNNASPPVQTAFNSNLRGLSNNNTLISTNLLSQNASTLSRSNIDGTNSDQLTIQYQAYHDLSDCEGRAVKEGQFVIERYFVRPEDASNTNSPLALACASAIYEYDETVAKKDASNQNAIDISKYTKADGSAGTSNLAGTGQVIVPNVDYFRVQLGVSDSKNFATHPDKLNLENINIPTNPYQTLKDKRIVNVQIALLVRSDNSVTASADATFNVLGNAVTLNTASNADGRMRRVMQSTILIRNARGSV